MNSLKDILDDAEHRMDASVDHVKNEFTHVRTGRATTALLDGIKVDYYGTITPLSQMANVSVPDSRLLSIQPWDKNMVAPIEKAILESDLGLNPQNDGTLIRIPIPQLSEERRKDLVKLIKKQAEEGRIAVRNVRRDANEHIKKFTKDNHVSEDEERETLDLIQKLTDKHIELIE